MTHTRLALLLTLSLVSAACTNTAAEAPPAPEPRETRAKIAILEDETGSRETTRTERVTPDVLRQAADALASRSGVLLFGTVRDASNLPFVRLTLTAAPARPASRRSGNVFQDLDLREKERRDLADFDTRAEVWETGFKTAFEAFERDVAARRKLTLARRSAIWASIARADVALAEPEAGPSSEGRRYILLASDGQETAGGKPVPLRSGATLVVVNGAGTLGSLAGVPDVHLFENLQAAFAWVLDREGAATRSGQ